MPRRWRCSAALVTLMLAVSTLANPGARPPRAEASSAKKVTLSPASGPVGRTVTASFSNFTKNHSITISWDGKTVATSRTSAAGDGSVSFVAPTAKKGGHKVAATMGTVSASAIFTIVPKISLSRGTSRVGETITATLRGYGKGESVDIGLDTTSTTLVTVVASSTGSGSAKVVVPAATGGEHKIAGFGDAGSRSQASLTVAPSLTVSPGSGPEGANILVTLRGYGKSESIEIQLRIGGRTQALKSATASTKGSASVTIALKLPENGEPGHGAIVGVGRTNARSVAEAPFDVT
jgi:hypothetical protein